MSKCIEMVANFAGFDFIQCKYDAVDGGRFCGVHDPERKKARAAKRGPSKWERQFAVETARAAAIKQDREDLAEALSLLRVSDLSEDNQRETCENGSFHSYDERRAALLAKHEETK